MWRYQPGVVAMNPNLHNDGEGKLAIMNCLAEVTNDNAY